MSSVFNTIYRDELLKIVEGFLDKDDMRVLSTVLAETTLESKVENAQATTLESNIGSPQGNTISGPLFTLYFNRALQQIKNEMRNEPIDCRDMNPRWVEKMESCISEEIVYADDCVFLAEINRKSLKIYQKAKEIMKKQKPVSEWRKDWIYHRENRIKRRGNGMKKCDKSGIKDWWLGRDPEKKRIGNYYSCKEWQNLKKELENETDNQNPSVRDASEKYTVVQLRNLGFVKGWPEKNEQFS